MNRRQKRMVGHGAILLGIGLLGGFGLLMSLIGGFEWAPGVLTQFEIPGDDRAWARIHAGGIMNGMMVMLGALLLWAMKLPDRPAFHIYWMLVGAGYANTVFYWGGMLAANRALTFGDNRFGETSAMAIVGLLPAFVFAFVTLAAMVIIAIHAFSQSHEADS